MGTHNIDLKIKTTGAKQATAQLNSLNKSISNTAKGVTAINSTTKAIHGNTQSINSNVSTLRTMATAAFPVYAAYRAIATGVKATTNLIKESNEAWKEQTKQYNRLKVIMKQAPGWYKDADKELIKYTESLAKLGIISDQVLQSGAAQLASFRLSPFATQTLTNSVGDILAWKYGGKADSGNAWDAANMIGKASMGLFGMLRRNGILFTPEEKTNMKAALDAKDKDKFAELLRDVITFNTGGFNLKGQDSLSGVEAAFDNALTNFKEGIGKDFTEALGLKDILKSFTAEFSGEFKDMLTPATTWAGNVSKNILVRGNQMVTGQTPRDFLMGGVNNNIERNLTILKKNNEKPPWVVELESTLRALKEESIDNRTTNARKIVIDKDIAESNKKLKKYYEKKEKTDSETYKKIADDIVKSIGIKNEYPDSLFGKLKDTAANHPFISSILGYNALRQGFNWGKRNLGTVLNPSSFKDTWESAKVFDARKANSFEREFTTAATTDYWNKYRKDMSKSEKADLDRLLKAKLKSIKEKRADYERGLVKNTARSRRMAMVGPAIATALVSYGIGYGLEKQFVEPSINKDAEYDKKGKMVSEAGLINRLIEWSVKTEKQDRIDAGYDYDIAEKARQRRLKRSDPYAGIITPKAGGSNLMPKTNYRSKAGKFDKDGVWHNADGTTAIVPRDGEGNIIRPMSDNVTATIKARDVKRNQNRYIATNSNKVIQNYLDKTGTSFEQFKYDYYSDKKASRRKIYPINAYEQSIRDHNDYMDKLNARIAKNTQVGDFGQRKKYQELWEKTRSSDWLKLSKSSVPWKRQLAIDEMNEFKRKHPFKEFIKPGYKDKTKKIEESIDPVTQSVNTMNDLIHQIINQIADVIDISDDNKQGILDNRAAITQLENNPNR